MDDLVLQDSALWKLLHLASLTSVAVSTILLILPAAYHRIVEQGEDSEMLHRITTLALLWAMAFLALGICGDFYVAARITGISMPTSATITSLLLIFFYGTWFGYSFWKNHTVRTAKLTRSHLRKREAA